MKKVCLLIHGYLTDDKDFTTLPNKLKELYDKIEMFIIPGHKDESSEDFTIQNVLKRIEETLKKINQETSIIDVIGFSLGGAIAKYIACNYKINKLVMLAPAVKYFSPKTIIRKIDFLLTNEFDDENSKFKNIVKEDLGAVKFFASSLKKKFNLKSYKEFAKIISHINNTTTTYNAKTLIIWGYFDELVPKKAIEKCYNDCQNQVKSIIIIPNMGHYMFRSSRGEVIQTLIINFLK